MKKIIPFFSFLLVLVCSACDYNPLRFMWTDQDVDSRVAESLAYNEENGEPYEVIAGTTYSVILASDTHIQEDTTNIHNFFSIIDTTSASMVFYNGDIFHGQEKYAPIAKDILSKSPMTPYYICGNHDVFFGWANYFKNFGSSTYTLTVEQDDAQDLYIILESASATLGRTQYDWLNKVLESRSKFRHCFIFTHTNFFFQGPTNGVFEQEEMHMLFRLFADNKVTAVISGHSHILNDQSVLGVRYITTGAIKNQEYGRMYVTSNGVEFEFLNWENPKE